MSEQESEADKRRGREEQRRAEVFALRFAYGQLPSDIAETLELPLSVVETDIQAIQTAMRVELAESNPLHQLVTDMAVLGFIRSIALQEASECGDHMAKSEYLRVAVEATQCRHQIHLTFFDSHREEHEEADAQLAGETPQDEAQDVQGTD